MSASGFSNSPAREQLSVFAKCLWEPEDLIEIRAFGADGSPERKYFSASEIDAMVGFISDLDQRRFNVCAGVAPRLRLGGKSADVALFRVVYADIDGCSVEEATAQLLRTTLPPPTMIISSGHGVHVYWRLVESVDVENAKTVRDLIGAIAQVLDADRKVKDAARVMRLPGSTNWKDAANPVPCCIVEASPERRVSLTDFDEATASMNSKPKRKGETKKRRKAVSLKTAEFLAYGAEEGERNDRLFAAACDMQSTGASIDEAKAALGPKARDSGMSDEEFDATVSSAYSQPRKPSTGGGDCNLDLPIIETDDRQFPSIVNDAWKAIEFLNKRQPTIFNRHGAIVRVDQGAIEHFVEVVDQDVLFGILARHANWVRKTPNGYVATRPPKDLARDMVIFIDKRLARLDGVIFAPAFSKKGTLIQSSGYHAGEATFYIDVNKLQVDTVPLRPSPEQIDRARRVIVEEILVDFFFLDAASKAHAIAAFILPFVRMMIPGATPIHLIAAWHPGSGKGLLADCISFVATGKRAEVQVLPPSDDELRKRVTAILLEGMPIVMLDNLPATRSLDSAALAAAITSRTWKDRLLGTPKMVRVPNESMWILTGNSPKFTTELARRTIRIFLNPPTDKPWERTGFRHGDLAQWVSDNRALVVHSILVLVQAWIAKGRPEGKRNLGSFETWARVMGGILDVAGVEGFLGDREALHDELDSGGREWREFVDAWHEEFGDSEKSVTELVEFCDQYELMATVIRGEQEKARVTSLGRLLAQRADAVIGRFVLVQSKPGGKKHGKRYRLVLASTEDGGGTSPDPGGTFLEKGSPHVSDYLADGCNGAGNIGDLGSTNPTSSSAISTASRSTDSDQSTKPTPTERQPKLPVGGDEVPKVPRADRTHDGKEDCERGTSDEKGSPPGNGGSPPPEKRIVEGDA